MKSFLLLFIFLLIGCGNSILVDDSKILPDDDKNKTQHIQRVYGIPLKNDVQIKTFNLATLYMPKEIKIGKKLPVVLLASGWSSQNHIDYKTLLAFIASQGYIAIYASSPMEYRSIEFIDRYLAVLEDETVSKQIDKQKIGVIGHSSGAGIAFKILDYFAKHGYGEKGRFIFSMDPWFAFEMNRSDFKDFPKNTKVVIQQYLKNASTDPRIALSIYSNLAVLGDKNLDYQVYTDLGHGYPFGVDPYEQKQIILKPLDALMDYVFNLNQSAYDTALAIGSDKPYQDNLQPVAPSVNYPYKCYGEIPNLISVLGRYDLDYCIDYNGLN